MEAREFSVEGDGPRIAGESIGEGPPLVLLHGVTATRRYVVHGSVALARAGHSQLAYDARGHGRSEPAPPGAGYSYDELVSDLGRVVEARLAGRRLVLAGHSMGAHTALAYALADSERLAGLVAIGPAFAGYVDPDSLAGWDRLADALERDGVPGFMAAYDRGLDPTWRETVLRFTRQRMSEHLHPSAVAEAMRQVPRSAPFESLSELEFCEVPALVVASDDVADPGHPRAVGAAWAERLPRARLIGGEEGGSPLAWQGGRLSREIAAFCAEPAVAKRLRG